MRNCFWLPIGQTILWFCFLPAHTHTFFRFKVQKAENLAPPPSPPAAAKYVPNPIILGRMGGGEESGSERGRWRPVTPQTFLFAQSSRPIPTPNRPHALHTTKYTLTERAGSATTYTAGARNLPLLYLGHYTTHVFYTNFNNWNNDKN